MQLRILNYKNNVHNIFTRNYVIFQLKYLIYRLFTEYPLHLFTSYRRLNSGVKSEPETIAKNANYNYYSIRKITNLKL